MILQKRNLSIEAELFLAFLEGRISDFLDYKDLANFLEVYHYDYNSGRHRGIEPGLIEELFYWNIPKTDLEVLRFYQAVSYAKTLLRRETQKELINFIQTYPSNRIKLFLKEEKNEL